ncbi:MAG TPA: MurR/RpiR family transcriptional regulator [Pyrinomonadaceae bacterium]
MEKKKLNSVGRGATKRRTVSRDGTGTLAANDGDGVSDVSKHSSPLGARFFDTQAGLSSSRQRLVRQIIDESNETFFLSSREMGRRYNVDTATIIRTVQALGYEKFADFAQDLREHFVTQITPYSAMKAAEQSNRSVSDLVRQSVDQDLENLNAFRAELDPAKIIEIAKQINHARRIVVLGIDFAASLAGSLAYALVRLGYDADAPVGSSGSVQNKIRIMTPKDLLIAISFGRGLRDTVEAVQNARRRNVPSFGITDGDTTPIAKYCDGYLVAATTRTSFIDSYVAPTAALHSILVACAHSQSARALEHLRASEEENFSSARWYSETSGKDGKEYKR